MQASHKRGGSITPPHFRETSKLEVTVTSLSSSLFRTQYVFHHVSDCLSGSVVIGICPIVSASQSAVLRADRMKGRVHFHIALYIHSVFPESQTYPQRISFTDWSANRSASDSNPYPGTLASRPSSINQPPRRPVSSTAITIVNYAQNKQRARARGRVSQQCRCRFCHSTKLLTIALQSLSLLLRLEGGLGCTVKPAC